MPFPHLLSNNHQRSSLEDECLMHEPFAGCIPLQASPRLAFAGRRVTNPTLVRAGSQSLASATLSQHLHVCFALACMV